MAICNTSSVLILISIILVTVTPSSASNQMTGIEIKHLCSKTSNSARCYKLLKSNHHTDCLAGSSVDLAYNKANKIRSELNSFSKATHDSHMRNIYNSCSKNYDDAIRDLEVAKQNLNSDIKGKNQEVKFIVSIVKPRPRWAKRSFDSNDYQNIPEQVDDIEEELESCRHELDEGASDPAHIGDRNKEFGVYVDLLMGAIDCLLQENYSN
ncbi:hypothetical protein BUALT_Bualt03G0011300 [Buddleja alternifolia]|uniref:Pectinesterase inhibitor domain-containing protein n=1 Tax=Buddleja alternifolia TaxID=168488 RepID=A0AAV6XUK2_9LAMI|nr:hypothetical protein BUALT_Bualt03G0011300 [Buddleja alternifolia]